MEEKRRYIIKLKPILEGNDPPKEKLRQWLRTGLLLSTEMPLVSKLLCNDQELIAVYEEMNVEVRDKVFTMQQRFITDMLDQAAAPHRWTAEELEDRAKVLLGLFQAGAGLVVKENMRRDLSLERYASIFADLIVDGVCQSSTCSYSTIIKGEE